MVPHLFEGEDWLSRTTTRSCRDPETAVSNFWSPGGARGRLQRVPSAGSDVRRLLLLPPPPPPPPPLLLLLLRVSVLTKW